MRGLCGSGPECGVVGSLLVVVGVVPDVLGPAGGSCSVFPFLSSVFGVRASLEIIMFPPGAELSSFRTGITRFGD